MRGSLEMVLLKLKLNRATLFLHRFSHPISNTQDAFFQLGASIREAQKRILRITKIQIFENQLIFIYVASPSHNAFVQQ